MPIQVFVQRLISFSPAEKPLAEREILRDFNWQLTGLNGDRINFSRSQGKVAVVNFWATWCPPCVAEMPSFQKLYEAYGNRVDFYFISSENPDRVARFLKKNEYTLPVQLQIHKAPDPLEASVLPTTYIISKSGEIIVDEQGAADWNDKKVRALLDRLLNE